MLEEDIFEDEEEVPPIAKVVEDLPYGELRQIDPATDEPYGDERYARAPSVGDMEVQQFLPPPTQDYTGARPGIDAVKPRSSVPTISARRQDVRPSGQLEPGEMRPEGKELG